LIFSYRVNMNIMSLCQWVGTLLYKRIILGKVGPGVNLRKNQWMLFRFALYRRLKELPGDQMFLNLLGDTAIGRFGMRFSGITAGDDVFATGLSCMTPDALVLGDFMCSGGQSVASCVDKDGIVHPITLGMGVTLGNHTMLFPGSSVGVGCILGSNTYTKAGQQVPANTRLQGNVVYQVDPSADLEALAGAAETTAVQGKVSIRCTRVGWNEFYTDSVETICKLLFFNSNVDVQWGIILLVVMVMLYQFGYVSLLIYFAVLPVATAAAILWLRVLSYVLLVRRGWKQGSASVWTLRAKMSSGVIGPMTEALVKPFMGTPFAQLILRGMGAKIGKGTVILGGVPTETALMEVGDYAVLDHECETSGHYLTNQKFTYIPIKIGAGAWVGSNARVQAGAALDERSRLLPGSNVLPGETIATGSVWAGIPAAPSSGK